MSQRLSYDDSCRALQRLKILPAGEVPPLPYDPPRFGDQAPFGIRFFRTELVGLKLQNLTLPRTFFGRSEIREVSFRNADLSESTAHWNDFIKVDFFTADLTGCDLRGCVFERTKFIGATLRGVDFRYCGFKNCDFRDADLSEARLTIKTAKFLKLTPEQEGLIDAQVDDGEEPEGG
jgi:uncharacterized protein YjbI with pentapeptide repeats